MDSQEKGKFINKRYAGNRIDMLCAAIIKCNKRHPQDFGIGGLDLNPYNPIYEPNQFYGKKYYFML